MHRAGTHLNITVWAYALSMFENNGIYPLRSGRDELKIHSQYQVSHMVKVDVLSAEVPNCGKQMTRTGV